MPFMLLISGYNDDLLIEQVKKVLLHMSCIYIYDLMLYMCTFYILHTVRRGFLTFCLCAI